MAVQHSELEWLLMHYRVRHYDCCQALLLEKEEEGKKYSNAMMHLNVSEAGEFLLSSETDVSAYRIAVWQKDMEEQVVQFVTCDEENLESAKDCCLVLHPMNNDVGNKIGARLWD